jgi:probable HAF family extracellular repeat protein
MKGSIRALVGEGLVWLLLAGNALAGGLYALSDLGNLAGNDAMAINNGGQVVGGRSFTAGYHAFLYSGGAMQDLGTLYPTQNWSDAIDINNAGTVVGASEIWNDSGESNKLPFLYSGGVMTEVPGFGGGYGAARGINKLGQVVGISAYSNGVTHAFLYSAGSVVDLGAFMGATGYSCAYGINDQTQVVGVSPNQNGADRGFLWQNGSMTDLGDVGGGTGGAYAYHINNGGQVVGESWSGAPTSQGPHYAFLWQNGVMSNLGVLPGANGSLAEGINDSGVVVGSSGNRLFVWDSVNGMRDANNLLDASGAGWTLYGCRDINDLGQIAGWGTNPSGQTHGFILTPVPEPSIIALLGIAIITYLIYFKTAAGTF